MKQLIYVVFAVLLLASCSSDEPTQAPAIPTPAEPIELSRSEQEIIDAQKDFAIDFFKKVYGQELPNHNILVSPLSMSMALSMASNGAEGETLAEIANVLGFRPTELQSLNSLNKTLLDKLPSVDPTAKVSVANSFWRNQGRNANSDFSKRLLENYKATAYSTNLHSKEGALDINAWIEKATDGKIPELLNQGINADFALCNALYFEGKWTLPFKESQTVRGTFYNSNGTQSGVYMMGQDEYFDCYLEVGDDEKHYSDMSNGSAIVRMEYGNGAYAMTFVMPRKDLALSEFVSGMTVSDMASWEEKLNEKKIDVRIPRFECEYGKDDYSEELKSMGIVKAFTSGAEFPNILDINQILGAPVQKCIIKVDESGTKAASATVIPGMDGDVWLDYVVFNHPFMYYISEQSTGAILFMGCVNAF